MSLRSFRDIPTKLNDYDKVFAITFATTKYVFKMRALVISGGGSKGAFAGGVAQYLIEKQKRDYKVLIGCSTGSLLVPHLSIGKIEEIRKAYTSVCMDDIYSISPFKIRKNKDGTVSTSIRHLNVLRMFAKGKKTFGEHNALRNTIKSFLSKETFKEVKANDTKVALTVSNLSNSQVEYKYDLDQSYEDFVDWMWASCSYVPFMGVVKKEGMEYADGGFGNFIPIREAINAGATEVDVIILTTRHRKKAQVITKNPFELFMHTMHFMLNQSVYDDILIGHLLSIYDKSIKVNFFFTPRDLTPHSFYFDKDQMNGWWDEGLAFAEKRCKEIF